MATPNSRDTLIEYCLRRLGDPVIEINVDPDQLEDRVDEAIQYYQEYHSDATYRLYLKHQITADDVTNKYIPISSNILAVTRMFPIATSTSTQGMFSIKYQLHLNDLYNVNTFVGELGYYNQMQQYLSLLDMEIAGTQQITFSRKQKRLYIHGEFENNQLREDDYIVVEAFATVNPDDFTAIYNDKWLKEYTTALIKQQWGANLIKFEGMQLPGGVTLNGRQIFEDATADIERLREAIRSEFEAPVDFFIG